MDRISAQQSKLIKRLGLKKYRKIEGSFLIEGPKLFDELLSQDLFTLKEAFIAEELYAEKQWDLSGFKYGLFPAKEVARYSALKSSPGLIAIVSLLEARPKLEQGKGWTLVLDGINDPGNLGTLIRIADWYNLDQIICTEDTADCYNSKVVQSTMGSLFRKTPQYYPREEIASFLETQKNVFTADMQGKSLETMQFPESGYLIMGSESHGPS